MKNNCTVARPYAKAIFMIAKFSGLFDEWLKVLKLLKACVETEEAQEFLKKKNVSNNHKAQLLIDVCGKDLKTLGVNLVWVLAKNGRISLVPEIVKIYEALKKEEEKKVDVTLLVAQHVNQSDLVQLEKRIADSFSESIELQCHVDESLIGGGVVLYGDNRRDASVFGQIKALHDELKR